MDKVLVRVINKNAEGALVSSLAGDYQNRFTWEDFNHYFKPTKDKFVYEMSLSDEEREAMDKQLARLNWFTPERMAQLMFATNDFSMQNALLLGTLSHEYLDAFPGLTMIDFTNDFKSMRDKLINKFGVKNG